MFEKLFDWGGSRSNKVRSVKHQPHKSTRHNITAKQLHSTKLHSKSVIGKVYANWCGHCKTLIPEWTTMKNNIKNKFPDKYIFSEIEEKNSENGVENINKLYVLGSNPKLTVNGFPTVYKILNGKVEYYSGARKAPEMEKWFLNGGAVGPVGPVGGRRTSKRTNKRKQSRKHRK